MGSITPRVSARRGLKTFLKVEITPLMSFKHIRMLIILLLNALKLD
jgi:hypothetical protein